MRVILDLEGHVWHWKVVGDPNAPTAYQGSSASLSMAFDDIEDSVDAYRLHKLRWNLNREVS